MKEKNLGIKDKRGRNLIFNSLCSIYPGSAFVLFFAIARYQSASSILPTVVRNAKVNNVGEAWAEEERIESTK